MNTHTVSGKERVEKGLKNFWYPVVPGYMVKNAPFGITRLSENIVLWRDENGQIRAVEDRCPHRGARLSLGWNLGDRLACWYHGVEVNDGGVIAKVPAVAGCPLEGQKCLRKYPATEMNGAVFLWFGDDETVEPTPIAVPEEMRSDEFSGFLCMQNWQCNHRYAVDNVMDPMHGAYLHATSHSMSEGERQADMEIKKTGTGLLFQKTGQRGLNFDWVEFGMTSTMWVRLSVPYRKQYGGGEFYLVGFVTPVDELNCQVYFWRIRKSEGFERNAWRFLYRNRLEGLHWDVLEQDRLVIESLGEDARSLENLYQHDVGLAQVRRIMEKTAEAQIKALQAKLNPESMDLIGT